MGVLMAIILDDDRSRENFHSIDHNYFDGRLPLASNCGGNNQDRHFATLRIQFQHTGNR